jgi:hypothetical protein
LGPDIRVAARLLDEIEGKGAQASDEAGTDAQFQQQQMPPEKVAANVSENDQEADNGCAEESNRHELSGFFEVVAPDDADKILAGSFTKNIQLFDLLLRYRTNRQSAISRSSMSYSVSKPRGGGMRSRRRWRST